MNIQTIEQALAEMGSRLADPVIASAARSALANGASLEVTVVITGKPQGATATLTSREVAPATSHGRLIKLS